MVTGRVAVELAVEKAVKIACDIWETKVHGFRFVKPCARCVMTTRDPNTGQRRDPDPLRALAAYRRVGKEVMFGHNAIAESFGSLRVGDAVTPGTVP